MTIEITAITGKRRRILFKMYSKLAGCTGTAATEAQEFAEIYNLPVLEIPTNVEMIRKDENDIVFLTQTEKYQA